MKSLFIFLFMLGIFNLRANELESSYTCLNKLSDTQYTDINEKAYYTPEKNLIWIEENKIILQKSERAIIFDLKLKQGLNVVSLANNKGRELQLVCISKQGDNTYIDSYGDNCLMMNKTKFSQSISYANESFESTDPISHKIYDGLNQLRISFKSNVNRNKCESYMNTFQSCYKNFTKLSGKNKIPRTERRYLFVLKEIRRTLLSQCQSAV